MFDSYRTSQKVNKAMSKDTRVGACGLKVAFVFLYGKEINTRRIYL